MYLDELEFGFSSKPWVMRQHIQDGIDMLQVDDVTLVFGGQGMSVRSFCSGLLSS